MRPRLPSPAALAPAAALALALAAAALAGCGESPSASNGVASKSPAQVAAAATDAAAGAATVHVAGSIVSEGRPISLDMELVAGKGGQGRMTLAGLHIRLVRIYQALYINGSTAFYSLFAGPAAARALRGKWLKESAGGGALAALATVTDLSQLIDLAVADHGTLTRGRSKTIDGQRAVGLSDVAGGGTLYVATTGTPYPLEIVKRGAGKLVFDHWNQPVSLKAPASPININQLQTGH
jgi:hypothetical protein